METTAGKWIVEAGELEGMPRSDVHALKGYLSRQVDEARMSYGRKRTRMPRQFVIIGTSTSVGPRTMRSDVRVLDGRRGPAIDVTRGG